MKNAVFYIHGKGGSGAECEHYGRDSAFEKLAKQCCQRGNRAYFDDRMSDGSVVSFFVRRIADNPVTGKIAVAIAVLSITKAGEGATPASPGPWLRTTTTSTMWIWRRIALSSTPPP
jgi:hypothetical protein